MVDEAFWIDKRVLVTGANGFMGSYLCDKLDLAGARVFGLIRETKPRENYASFGLQDRIFQIFGSLEDFDTIVKAINENEIEIVFHLGAQSLVTVAKRSPIHTFRTNIMGTVNVLEACRLFSEKVKRVIIASSDKAYGTSETLPYKEDFQLKGEFPYDVSKTCTDLLARSYFSTYQLPVAITRFGNVFGGGDLHFDRLIPGVIASVLEGSRPVLRSDGKFIRDFIYVEDVIDAYLLLAEKLDDKRVLGEAFNFSYEIKKQVTDVVNDILEITGRTDLAPIILDDAESEIVDQYLSCEKAKTRLGWKPRWNYSKGLERTIDWYRNYFKTRGNATAPESEFT